MHLSDGEIRAYLDQENASQDVEIHLADCSDCRERVQKMSSSDGQTNQLLDSLEPNAAELPKSGQQAYILLEKRFINKEKISMYDRLFNRKYRFAWVAVGVIAILAVGM